MGAAGPHNIAVGMPIEASTRDLRGQFVRKERV